MTDKTPERYVPTDEKWRQKDWLYEQYWQQLKSAPEIAQETPKSEHAIRRLMDKHGIPRRKSNYNRDNTVSAFAGFYNDDEATRADEQSTSVYDPEWEPDEQLDAEWPTGKVTRTESEYVHPK